MSLVVWLRAPLGLPTIVMVWMLAFGIVAGLPIRLVGQLHDTRVAMIESHYAAHFADASRGADPITSGAVTVRNVQSALEGAGVEFTNGDQPGVRMRKSQ